MMMMTGYGKCLPSNISLSQSRSGVTVKGKPEWSVTVTNKCPCAQTNVVLNCAGFQSVESVDPSVLTLSKGGNFCLLTPGQPLNKNGVVRFKYAWDHQFSFHPTSTQSSCP